MSGGLLVERLRDFLRELSPEARSLLMTELERGLLRGEETPGAELVLQELRRDARDVSRPKRPGNLSRLFFQPLEPFLVDDSATHNHPGRIARVILEPIWEWICRDLMPGEAKVVTEQVASAFENGDAERAEQLARAFQDRTALRIEEMLLAAHADEKLKRRLAGQINTPRALSDLAAILTIIKNRETLAGFGARLPGHIKVFDGPTLSEVKNLLDSPVAGGPSLFAYALVMTMSHLASPWQLIRLATRAAGSDNAARIAEGPYAIAVEIALAEIERMIGELKAELRTGRGLATGALLKSIHDAARGIRSEINLTHDSPWSRRLAAQRTQVSDLLKKEIESLVGRVHRLLRPRPSKEIAPHATIDKSEVDDIEALIEFVKTCRIYASELAVNELTSRTWSELQNDLDTTTPSLVETLRNAGEADRAFRQSQLDAAVRFCGKVFGPDYASLLVKSGEVAVASEQKRLAAKA